MLQNFSRTAISVAAFAFLISALFLGLNAELARRNLHRLAEAQRSVLHTHEVLAELDAVMLGLKEAEIAQLGFLVTGDESYVARYVTAEVHINEHLERVGGFVGDNSPQAQRLIDARREVSGELLEFRHSIDAWKRQDLAAARAAVLAERDRHGAREVLAQMQNAERELLEERNTASKRDYRSALTSSVLAAVFGLVLLALAYSLVRRNLMIREQSAAIVREERERFLVTLRSIGDAVIVTDAQGRITFLNEVASSLTGWEEDAIGRDLMDVFRIENELTGAAVENPIHRVIRDNTIVGLASHTILLSNEGGRVPIDDSVAPVRNDRGEILGAVLVFRDVTRRRQQEEERRQADAAKDEFLAMLGHELRNPLAAVRNAITAAHLDENARGRALEIARRQTSRLSRLVDDLLDVARITRRKISLRKERISLNEVAQRAFEATRASAADRGHAFSIGDPQEPIEVEADPVRLEQVIDNLLTNAIKYTPPGGRIELTTCRENGEAVVRVRDDGVGIKPELLPKVFDSFVQSERSPERADGGLGIGLTIVKRLVELHGGRVAVRSEGPGSGAEFIIRLPALAASEPRSPAAAPPAPTRRHAVRVLIVEDNIDAAEALGLLLEVAGVEARIAHDGREALEVARQQPFPLILVDIGLPGMDGYEVARRLRELPECATTLLVALTGYGRSEDRQKALEAGFAVHLVKPVELELLEPLLARVESAAQNSGNP
jgi:PAS domain S-box-containing protein